MLCLNVEQVLGRMKNLIQVKTDKDLAGYLLVKTTTFSAWKKNNSIPLEILISFADKNSVTTDWLLFGKEPENKMSIDEQMVLSAYRQLSQQQKLNALTQMSGLQTATNGSVAQTINGNFNSVIAGNMTVARK